MKRNSTSPINDRRIEGLLEQLRTLYTRQAAVSRLIASLEEYQRAAGPAAGRAERVFKQAA